MNWKDHLRDPRWQFAALILLAALAHLKGLSNGFIWDDDHYVINNATLRSLDGLRQIWFEVHATPQYYPLVHTSFWMEYQLWGLNPLGYHLTNVVLHGLAAGCLFISLRHLKVPGAWAVAAIFTVHPVTVESVAWVTERKNVLSAVFYFLALLAFMRAVRWNDDSKEPVSKKAYSLALALFVCALLSKTVVCSLPAVILLLLWRRADRFTPRERRDALLTLPFFIVGAALAINTVLLERTHVGAEGMEWNFSFVERCLIAGRSIWFYAGKLVWPTPLIFFYERWNINSGEWWQYLFPASVLAILIVTVAMHKRWGKGLPVALMIFSGTLLPALGFFNVYPHRYSFVADHFQYLAMPAFLALVVAGAAIGVRKLRDRAVPVSTAALGSVLVLLICLSNLRSVAYADQETLWLDTIEQNPTSWAAYNNLGNEYMTVKRYEEALGCFVKTVQLKPDHLKAIANMGMIYASPEFNAPVKAEICFNQAVARGLRHPPVLDWLVTYYTGEGTNAMRAGQNDKAKGFFSQAIVILELQPISRAPQQRIRELKLLISKL